MSIHIEYAGRVSPRSDAVRSRAAILEAARSCDRDSLRHNDLAQKAGVGVATVYRHFPTVHALLEALVETDLERYRDLARRACDDLDPWNALERLVRDGLAMQLLDDGLQAVFLAPQDASEHISAVKAELVAATDTVVARAVAAGVVRADLTPLRLQHLVCGAEHAVRLGGEPDREFHLGLVLEGLKR